MYLISLNEYHHVPWFLLIDVAPTPIVKFIKIIYQIQYYISLIFCVCIVYIIYRYFVYKDISQYKFILVNKFYSLLHSHDIL